MYSFRGITRGGQCPDTQIAPEESHSLRVLHRSVVAKTSLAATTVEKNKSACLTERVGETRSTAIRDLVKALKPVELEVSDTAEMLWIHISRNASADWSTA